MAVAEIHHETATGIFSLPYAQSPFLTLKSEFIYIHMYIYLCMKMYI